jgi:hypothetical protein
MSTRDLFCFDAGTGRGMGEVQDGLHRCEAPSNAVSRLPVPTEKGRTHPPRAQLISAHLPQRSVASKSDLRRGGKPTGVFFPFPIISAGCATAKQAAVFHRPFSFFPSYLTRIPVALHTQESAGPGGRRKASASNTISLQCRSVPRTAPLWTRLRRRSRDFWTQSNE